MKKTIGLTAVAIFCCLFLPVNGFFGYIISQDKESALELSITEITIKNIPEPKLTSKVDVPIVLRSKPLRTDIPAASTENQDIHPTLGVSNAGNIFGAYSIQESIISQNVAFIYSSSQGQTWEDLGLYELEGVQDYPAIDYWGQGNSFVGTFTPDPSDFDGSAQYLLRVGDPIEPDTWELTYWDWTDYGQHDRESPDIAGYSDVGDATHWYGIIVSTSAHDEEGISTDHSPVLNFPSYTDPNSGWGWWWYGYENAAHASDDIDRSNGQLYAVWDQYNESRPEQGRDILLCTVDVHDWWAENWTTVTWYYLGGVEDNTYPDVAAQNGYVYIAQQADVVIPGKQDIICYYSHDGGNTWDISTIAGDSTDDEMYPSIVAYGEGATCTYVVDGTLYSTHTDDGGLTWSTPEQVNDVEGQVSMDYRTAKTTTNGHTLWTDISGDDADIYYGTAGLPPTPILSIGDINGGFGVKTTIANVGTAVAENVAWAITFDGLVFLGKEKSGTISIQAGAEETINTGLILGIGSVTITVTANDATKTAEGFALGPLVLGVE